MGAKSSSPSSIRPSRAMSPPESRVSISADFLGLHVQFARDAFDLVGRHRAESLLHAAQVEEELALSLGRGDLHQAPVLQDVLVDFGLDPVQRERNQPHSALRVEALHRLHQADVAFLDQVSVRQAVAEVVAGHGNHQAKVGHDQPAGGVEVIAFAIRAREAQLFLRGQHRHPIDRLDVGVDAADMARVQRQCVRDERNQSVAGGARFCHSFALHAKILALRAAEC